MNLPIHVATLSIASVMLTAMVADAQGPRLSRQRLHQPVYRVAQAPTAPATPRTQQASEHPLAPMVAKAREMLKKIDAGVQDYSATLVKRERIDGVLHDYQYIYTKIRHEKRDARGAVQTPFSVYMSFLAPEEIKGREVIYVKGRNDGKLIAHDGGTGLIAAIKSAVTVSLDPNSERAMRGQKYPITDVGMQNLLHKLIEVATEDMQYDDVEVKTFNQTKINGRVCTCLQSVHAEKNDKFRFHIARIYVDDELQLPIRYESYGWPQRQGEKPPLLEEYTYLNLKLNNGFTDRDFDKSNASYNFN